MSCFGISIGTSGESITFPSHLYYSEESLLCVLASED